MTTRNNIVNKINRIEKRIEELNYELELAVQEFNECHKDADELKQEAITRWHAEHRTPEGYCTECGKSACECNPDPYWDFPYIYTYRCRECGATYTE